MRRLKVLAKGLTEVEVAAAKKLAAEAGFNPGEIEIVPSVGDPIPEYDDEIVLVVMTPSVCADAALEGELKETPNGGRRAICVWPAEGPAALDTPAGAANYAYSIIPWNAAKLRAVASDDDVLCFETPAGAPLPKVKMEHNLCIDDGAEPK
jgi:hypothetical protein